MEQIKHLRKITEELIYIRDHDYDRFDKADRYTRDVLADASNAIYDYISVLQKIEKLKTNLEEQK